MRPRRSLFISANILLALSLVVDLAGCSAFKKVHREVATPESFLESQGNNIEQLKKSSPFMKVHMQNGSTYVLQDWSLDDQWQRVAGRGTLYNVNRDSLREGQFQVGLDSVAILETNVLKTSGAVAALTIFTGITAAVTINCIANPKACFGSCPTFYVSDGDSLRLKAEGFSASIAPSLEATDVDALLHSSAAGEDFDVEMRNEALETHVVRHVDLLAVPEREVTVSFPIPTVGSGNAPPPFLPFPHMPPKATVSTFFRMPMTMSATARRIRHIWARRKSLSFSLKTFPGNPAVWSSDAARRFYPRIFCIKRTPTWETEPATGSRRSNART